MPQRARLYQPPKTAMQSGTAGTHRWVLDYLSDAHPQPDPLMGWIGGGDTQTQVRLRFKTREEALAFAAANDVQVELETPQPRRIRPKAYADNFKVTRWENWTH